MNPKTRTAVLAALALSTLALLVLRSWSIDQPYSIDFQTYWLAGKRVAAGEASSLYAPGGGPAEGIPLELPAREFKNLPIVSALFVPFAGLDYLAGKRAFWWLGLAAILLAARLVSARDEGLLAAVALFAAMDPAHVSLRHGQTTPLVLLVLAGALASLRGGRDRLAGTLVGLACLVKFPPLALVAGFVLRGNRRAALAALATIGAGVALSLALFGPALHAEYLRGLAEHAGTVMTGHNNQSLLAAATRFLVPSPALDWTPRAAPLAAKAIAWALAAGLAAVLALSLRESAGLGAFYTAAMTLGTIALPVAWDHYLLLLAPGVFLLSEELGERGLLARSRWGAPFALGALAILLPTPHRLLEAADSLGRVAAPALAVECAGAIVLFFVAIAAMRERA